MDLNGDQWDDSHRFNRSLWPNFVNFSDLMLKQEHRYEQYEQNKYEQNTMHAMFILCRFNHVLSEVI